VVRVPVPADHDDMKLRTIIAEVALTNNILVVGMVTHRENLEQRFLEATRNVQEYHTDDAVAAPAPTN